MWTCSCRTFNWLSQKACRICGRVSDSRPVPEQRRQPQQVPTPQLHALAPQQADQTQGAWQCGICQSGNCPQALQCEMCAYPQEQCRRAEQEVRRQLLSRYPPPWDCICGCINIQSLMSCRQCNVQKPTTFVAPFLQAPKRVWRPVQRGPRRPRTPQIPISTVDPRITPVGAQPNPRRHTADRAQVDQSLLQQERTMAPPQQRRVGDHIFISNDQQQPDGNYELRQSPPAAELQWEEQIHKVQTDLASELRPVIDCDVHFWSICNATIYPSLPKCCQAKTTCFT